MGAGLQWAGGAPRAGREPWSHHLVRGTRDLALRRAPCLWAVSRRLVSPPQIPNSTLRAWERGSAKPPHRFRHRSPRCRRRSRRESGARASHSAFTAGGRLSVGRRYLSADREEEADTKSLLSGTHISVGTRIVHSSGSWAAAPSATFNKECPLRYTRAIKGSSCTLPYSQPPPRHGTTPRLHGGHGPALFSTPRLKPTAPSLPRAHRGPSRPRPARGAPPPAAGRAAAP